MAKSDRRRSRRQAAALARTAGPERRLLARILDTPHLARVVPRLQPEVLHKVIQTCGLEDCAELVALSTPGQLAGVFDLDLWRSVRPGLDEQLDAERFGLWLDVLMDAGPAAAAEKLVAIDPALITAALAQHLRVFDPAAVAPIEIGDGDEASESRGLSGGTTADIGGYIVEAKRSDAWDSIVALLLALDVDHPHYFHRVMRGCRRLSNNGFEIDGLHDLLLDGSQDVFDLTVGRESRRGGQGFVTPAQASAFLQMARQYRPAAATPPNPIARAYFRDVAWTVPSNEEAQTSAAAELDADAAAVAEVSGVLRDAGVLTQDPRGLLAGATDDSPRLARFRAQLQRAAEKDPAVHSRRSEELAYLANTLVAGCPIQGRGFTPREASDAVAAVCNLGLESWPSAGPLPDDFLVEHELVDVFQAGWSVLHRDVAMFTAERLIRVLSDLRWPDRSIQADVNTLRDELARHWRAGEPWRACGALDVVLALDRLAWAALLGLIAEYPVLHGAVGALAGSPLRVVSASAFEFISENRQIASVRAFIDALPQTLRL